MPLQLTTPLDMPDTDALKKAIQLGTAGDVDGLSQLIDQDVFGKRQKKNKLR